MLSPNLLWLVPVVIYLCVPASRLGFSLSAMGITIWLNDANSLTTSSSSKDSMWMHCILLCMASSISVFVFPTPAKTMELGLNPVESAALISLPLTQSAPIPLLAIISRILALELAFTA